MDKNGSPTIAPMALKEWDIAVTALEQGKQIIMMRKGGIAEETKRFEIKSPIFYLMPTFEHQKQELVKEGEAAALQLSKDKWDPLSSHVMLRSYARMERDDLVSDIAAIERLYPLHIWSERFADERLKWKRKEPLHVMSLRVYRLKEEIRLPLLAEYSGCKSWVDLPIHMDHLPEAEPVLDEQSFIRACQALDEALHSAK